jgi:hypothetical protein
VKIAQVLLLAVVITIFGCAARPWDPVTEGLQCYSAQFDGVGQFQEVRVCGNEATQLMADRWASLVPVLMANFPAVGLDTDIQVTILPYKKYMHRFLLRYPLAPQAQHITYADTYKITGQGIQIEAWGYLSDEVFVHELLHTILGIQSGYLNDHEILQRVLLQFMVSEELKQWARSQPWLEPR